VLYYAFGIFGGAVLSLPSRYSIDKS